MQRLAIAQTESEAVIGEGDGGQIGADPLAQGKGPDDAGAGRRVAHGAQLGEGLIGQQ